MGKPRMIILIRHAQSEGNKNREIHQTVPDHRVKLTPEGHRQAREAGRKLRELLRPDDTLHFFTSPYRRTRETTEGILESLTSDDPTPSPFPRHTIKVYEEPRLREQDFGNFQPCSAEMERMWQERADYGHFFYRIPNGESAADAYDRVSGFNESLWRLFGEDDFASVCILVTHGLMTRVFLMKWYHFSVEYFEDLRNINHCEFVVMKKNPDNGKYVLQNKLRTWSELKKEKELERELELAEKGLKPAPVTPSDGPIPVRRRWGGCPDGCDHGLVKTWRDKPRRQNTIDLFRDDDDGDETSDAGKETQKQDRSKASSDTKTRANLASVSRSLSGRKRSDLAIVAYKREAIDDMVSSPDQTPSYISLAALTHQNRPDSPAGTSEDDGRARRPSLSRRPPIEKKKRSDLSHLRPDTDDERSPASRGLALRHLGGRDGGGSNSGVNSLVPSDEEGDHPIEFVEDPAHYIEDDGDGDDESGSQRRARRGRQQEQHHHHHHHHHHYHTPAEPSEHNKAENRQVEADVLGDGDNETPTVPNDVPEPDQGVPVGEETFEEEKREGQSIRQTVY
ncbi:hypothetical protein DTO027B9_5249 [Paecilomyces variotii]|nr:hypothetical protein DTO027B9_5249 [Paecilomyces variotii]